MSSGVGRLHFPEALAAVRAVGVDARLAVGYVPRPSQRLGVNLAGRLLGRRNLYDALSERLLDGQLGADDLHSMLLAEGVGAIAHRLTQLGVLPHGPTMASAWKFFGWSSRRLLSDIDIFHVRTGAGAGGAIATAKRRGARVVADHSIAHPGYLERVVGPELERFGLPGWISMKSPFWRQVVRDCEMADVVLVNSDFVKQTFVEQGFEPSAIKVVYLGQPDYFHGIKADVAIPAGRPVELLFTGGLILRKGSRVLLEALDELNGTGLNFRLTIAGSAAEADGLFSIQGRGDIRDLGRVPRTQVAELIAESDLYVFPTFAEGCAQSAMEALSAGLPVITTPACGLPGEAGVHYASVPAGDVNALVATIRQLADSELARRGHAQAGVELIQGSFGWANYGRSVVSVYEDLLAG